MWFKNLFVYRMTASWVLELAALEEALASHAQTPIGLTQPTSIGWTPMFDDLFAHIFYGQIMLKFKSEKKVVPGSAVKAAVAERVAEIEAREGRKPGKKERREIKDEVMLDLLPRAIPIEAHTHVWIDRGNGWIVIDTASQQRADQIMSLLIKTVDKLELQTLYVSQNPAAVMTAWLKENEGEQSFSIDRACVLKASDESRAVVRYTNSNLDEDGLREHIRMGKVCKELALTWEDRISFVLTDSFRIKKIRALDILMEDHPQAEDLQEAFNNDFVLMTGELNKMLNALIAAFGGEPPRVEEPNLFG